MEMYRKNIFLSGVALFIAPNAAIAQATSAGTPPAATASSAEQVGVADIVVTAQKRAQSINDVGMSINAVTSDALLQRGITNTADLTKAVPGFTYAPSPYATPVYTIRGVGLYESGLASSPAVTVYVDEVPLPFPIMTQAAGLDLERVEILKGPQGTLFGQNSTGGAINYVAAKPTSDFEAGASVTYERFDKIDASGFISGPLSSTLNARLAVRAIEGGAWQKSVTRPSDRLGDSRQLQGRLLLDWQASDRLKFVLNVNGWRDNSDTTAAQLIAYQPFVAPLAVPDLVANPPIATANARLAEWTADLPNRSRDRFYQIALRGDYELTDDVTLTSVTAYQHLKVDKFLDNDATQYALLDNHLFGRIKSFNQELRLGGDTGALKWVIGGNYDHADVQDTIIFNIPLLTLNQPFFGAPSPLGDIPRFENTAGRAFQKSNTYAAFGNLEYALTDHLSGHAGVRYTHSRRKGENCSFSPDDNHAVESVFEALQFLGTIGFLPSQTVLKNTPIVPIATHGCYSLTALPDLSPGAFDARLNEENLSWRVGLDYKTDGGSLLYANVSRGWKAGVISNINASLQSQFVPAKQERVDAYEVGFKAPLFDRRVRVNGAAFYYDYKDKQIRGKVHDLIFGDLEVLQNVPKSRIWGIEGDVVVQPIAGLDLSLGATYVNSKITGPFSTINQAGIFADYKGSPLPYTPKYQAVADAQYQFPITGAIDAFFGGSLTYHSKDNAAFATSANPAPDYRLKSYTLVDVRAGLAGPGDNWRVSLFGHNITNAYYWTTVFQGTDIRYRYAGMPVTYGVTVSVRTR